MNKKPKTEADSYSQRTNWWLSERRGWGRGEVGKGDKRSTNL